MQPKPMISAGVRQPVKAPDSVAATADGGETCGEEISRSLLVFIVALRMRSTTIYKGRKK
jgi:hypothetical protein